MARLATSFLLLTFWPDYEIPSVSPAACRPKCPASTSCRISIATTPQKQHPLLQEPSTNMPEVMNTVPNINTNTKRPKAKATRGKLAAALNAAAGRSTAATVATLCAQLYCYLSDALMWSACGAYYVSTWGSQKMPVILHGYACVFRSTHDSITKCLYMCQRYTGHRRYWNRVAIHSYIRTKSVSRAK